MQVYEIFINIIHPKSIFLPNISFPKKYVDLKA